MNLDAVERRGGLCRLFLRYGVPVSYSHRRTHLANLGRLALRSLLAVNHIAGPGARCELCTLSFTVMFRTEYSRY